MADRAGTASSGRRARRARADAGCARTPAHALPPAGRRTCGPGWEAGRRSRVGHLLADSELGVGKRLGDGRYPRPWIVAREDADIPRAIAQVAVMGANI